MNEENIIMEEQQEEVITHDAEKNALYTERMNLEAQLKASEPKVVKCAEAQASGMPMPYDIAELRRNRQQWQDRIEDIDIEIARYDGIEPTEEEVLAMAKRRKLEQIANFDASANVNVFMVNGNPMWLTFDERSRLKLSVEAAETAGATTMEKYFGGVKFEYPLAQWKQMIAAVENYAGQCLNVTEAHKAAVNALTDAEAVAEYNFTVGYPAKLNFGE